MRNAIFLIALATLAHAQSTPLSCDAVHLYIDGLPTACEMRETRLAASATLRVNPGPNGNIIVQAWDQPDILVRARIVAAAESEWLASAVAGLVAVDTSTGNVLGTGPNSRPHPYWSLDLEVHVPANVELTLETINGNISAQGAAAAVHTNSVNGNVNLIDVVGPVQTKSVNGNISVVGGGGDIAIQGVNGNVRIAPPADRWRGQTIAARMVNGSVELTAPPDLAAHVELSTRIGSIASAFPLPDPGRPGLGRTFSFDVGGGGPPVTLAVTNGTVRLLRAD